MRRTLLNALLFAVLSLIWGCDVQEFPELPDKVSVHLRLDYETGITEWNHLYKDSKTSELGQRKVLDTPLGYGKMRYIVRAYPLTGGQRSAQKEAQEFVFTQDIAEGYNYGVTLELAPGDYDFMVWSDLTENNGDAPFYNATDFAEITLSGTYQGSNDYRDAFRGTGTISLKADIKDRAPDTLSISMQRPLARFEFVTNDVTEFIEKETVRALNSGDAAKAATAEEAASRVNVEQYRVVFYFVGFMPCAYSMFTDKPVDSSTGNFFESTVKKLSGSEASLGFDYVFVNGKESAVTVKVGIYDDENRQLSISEAIEVPLKRNYHTVIRGPFLTSKASGGVNIDPDYNGDYNLFVH